VGSLLSSITCPVRADSHPRNWGEAWNAGFRGIVEPDNPTVLQKLHSLCPTIDEEHFTVNLLAVYEYSMLISYAHDSYVYGVGDYWQTSEETILLGHGDCEDQAINLATLIEALYKQTYGYIPFNLVWVVVGYVETPSGEGGHGWVLVNDGLLPKETIEEIKTVSVLEAVVNVFLGGIAYASDLINEIEASLNLAGLGSKNNQQLALFYSGERYFELEPTWNLPISEFYFKKYPYTQVYAIFNSQGYDPSPDFYPVEQPPFMGAEIKNIAFPNRVIVDNTCTTNVTVQNYDCGILGADLVVILKDYDLEVARQSAYVYKYWWQVKTFVFTLLAIEPARTEQMSAELYWNNWGNMILIDFKNFTIETISNKPDLIPISLFTYPEDACEGQLVVFNILGQNVGPKSATSFAIDILVDNQPFDSIWIADCSGFSGFRTQSKPWTAVTGTHFLRMIVDATSVVSEHNEANNEIVVPLVVRSNKGSYAYVQVKSSSDDSQKWNNTSGGGWQWNLTNGMSVAGCPYVFGNPPTGGEDNFGCGLRFTNITIPRGARINYACLELCAAWDDESQVRSKLHGQDTDDALSLSTLQDFDSRPWTSACVYWDDIPAWKTGSWYTSPDISMILQEIVDRPNWQSGNSIVVIWEDFESRSISYIENARRAWSFDGNPSLAPKLLIDYEELARAIVVPDDYSTIQEAVNAANDGDTVFVRNGTYYEHVVVNRSVSLIGEDEKSTIIDGEGAGNVAKITVDDVNMTGFTVQMSGGDVWDYSGITLQNCSNVNVFENSMIDNSWGICLENSTGNRINANTISRNKRTLGSWGGGVLLSNGASSNAVVDNIITDNLYNSVFVVSSGNSIVGNTIADNGYVGLRLDSGGSVIYHNNFENNTFHASTNSINTWDDGYPSGGNYWSDYDGADLFGGHYQNVSGSDGIGDIPYVVYGSNRDNYPLTKPYSGSHDVGITSFATSKTGCPPMPTVGQGFSLNVTMNTLNYGINAETLNLTTHANSTAIQTFANVAMAGRNSTTLTFAWNTSGFEHGNYTMTAHAEPVLGETDLADNTFLCWIIITIPGDINGDFTVDIYDAIILANAYNSKPGGQYWNPNADINSDNIVDIYDAIILANRYNQHYP
jgi:parallel beta-helix repeat protein